MKMFKPEFQAIILAGGRGSRIPELAASRPKCLLPIGNKPMVWYPLQMLTNAGFTEIILVILESQKAEILKAIDKLELKIKIDYAYIPNNEDLGTADSLRFISDRITSNMIVVSCDFISNFDIEQALNIFRLHDASFVSVLFNTENLETVSMPGPKSKYKPERDLIGIDLYTNRLVFQASSSDFDDTVTIPRKLLRKHPNITIFSRLLDAHFYIMKRWVLDYINYEKTFTTIKGELLPRIVKRQLSKKPKKVDLDKNQSIVNAEIPNDIFQFAKDDSLTEKVREASSYNDHMGDMKPAYHGDVIRCYSFLPTSKYIGMRVNTLQSYCLANKLILDKYNEITKDDKKQFFVKIHCNADVKSRQVDERCLIGEGTIINEKTSIKNTFIGSNCVVNNKTRILNCILLNNVKIMEKCVLQDSIICDGVVIENEVELKNCLVGNNYTVTEGSNYSNEVLTSDDKLMEI